MLASNLRLSSDWKWAGVTEKEGELKGIRSLWVKTWLLLLEANPLLQKGQALLRRNRRIHMGMWQSASSLCLGGWPDNVRSQCHMPARGGSWKDCRNPRCGGAGMPPSPCTPACPGKVPPSLDWGPFPAITDFPLNRPLLPFLFMTCFPFITSECVGGHSSFLWSSDLNVGLPAGIVSTVCWSHQVLVGGHQWLWLSQATYPLGCFGGWCSPSGSTPPSLTLCLWRARSSASGTDFSGSHGGPANFQTWKNNNDIFWMLTQKLYAFKTIRYYHCMSYPWTTGCELPSKRTEGRASVYLAHCRIWPSVCGLLAGMWWALHSYFLKWVEFHCIKIHSSHIFPAKI